MKMTDSGTQAINRRIRTMILLALDILLLWLFSGSTAFQDLRDRLFPLNGHNTPPHSQMVYLSEVKQPSPEPAASSPVPQPPDPEPTPAASPLPSPSPSPLPSISPEPSASPAPVAKTEAVPIEEPPRSRQTKAALEKKANTSAPARFASGSIKPVNWGDRSRPVVSLTFDDGYGRKSVTKALEILRQKEVVTTFFVVGDALKAMPDLWKQAVEDGHEICNHTQHHPNLAAIGDQQVKKEITGWEATARKVLGDEYLNRMRSEFPFLRLPGGGGSSNSRVLRLVNQEGYVTVGWTYDTYSTVLKRHNLKTGNVAAIAEEVVEYAADKAVKGSIILMHFNSFDVEKLDILIDDIRAKGLEFGKLSEVITRKAEMRLQ